MLSYELGTLEYNSSARTFDFSGNVFRVIPHGSTEPLSTAYSLRGGRWNPAGAFEVFYGFTNSTTARQYVTAQVAQTGVAWIEVARESQPDLLVLDWSISLLTDLATPQGLAVYNLPATYPAGFASRSAWNITQPIGVAIQTTGSPGILVRSASATNFDGAPVTWAELAIFPARVDPPVLIERLGFDAWYSSV